MESFSHISSAYKFHRALLSNCSGSKMDLNNLSSRIDVPRAAQRLKYAASHERFQYLK